MPKDSNKTKKEKKHFFKDLKAELKKVIWPTPKQLVNNTIAVITIVLITAVIVFVLDFAFETMNTYGINKLKSAVESNKTNSEITNTVEEDENTNTESTPEENNEDVDQEENSQSTNTAENNESTENNEENVEE